MTEQGNHERVEVRVGRWAPDGTFTGEVLCFAGEEVGSFTEYSGGDTRGVTHTLYRCPADTYRVHVESWTRWQGEESEASLHPRERTADSEGVQYTTYSEREARKAWAELFAALGMPNTRDID